MSPEDRILAAVSDLPRDFALKVLMDVDKRITDWRASGGGDHDAYIEQQVRYAENVAKAYKKTSTAATVKG
ncbi:hypothetical protein NE261_00555 [Enterococcus italicus]|uniref:DUF6877 family protein n=1 Tax=Enterococcus italicus TaxID=246144 RepID=UPI0020736B80|nr:DUF6877 family protein [Enterococcus italicus]MCM6930309.1 hypothetical protein [Enterococcus italicus]